MNETGTETGSLSVRGTVMGAIGISVHDLLLLLASWIGGEGLITPAAAVGISSCNTTVPARPVW